MAATPASLDEAGAILDATFPEPNQRRRRRWMRTYRRVGGELLRERHYSSISPTRWRKSHRHDFDHRFACPQARVTTIINRHSTRPRTERTCRTPIGSYWSAQTKSCAQGDGRALHHLGEDTPRARPAPRGRDHGVPASPIPRRQTSQRGLLVPECPSDSEGRSSLSSQHHVGAAATLLRPVYQERDLELSLLLARNFFRPVIARDFACPAHTVWRSGQGAISERAR